MAGQDMPAAEVDIDAGLVRRLLIDQFPTLSDLPVHQLAFGWDNVTFRIGLDHVARLPRRELAASLISNEVRWLPELAPRLPLPIPVPVFQGGPGHGYPWAWLIAPLLSGESLGSSTEVDYPYCARQLGRFFAALHRPAPSQAPVNPYRGGPLQERDEATRQRLAALVDRDRLEAVWENALEAEPYRGDPVWIHGDPHPGNLLLREGRVSGVIDFGDITAGDPATDLAIAWTFVPASHRGAFWSAYGDVDSSLTNRARGWALSLGTAFQTFSRDNPEMGAIGERTLTAVLEGD